MSVACHCRDCIGDHAGHGPCTLPSSVATPGATSKSEGAVNNTAVPSRPPELLTSDELCGTCGKDKQSHVWANHNWVARTSNSCAESSQLERERDGWMESAAQFCRNMEYYRGLVDRIGRAIGPEAYIADDGSVSDDVLRAKVPEIIERLLGNKPNAGETPERREYHANGTYWSGVPTVDMPCDFCRLAITEHDPRTHACRSLKASEQHVCAQCASLAAETATAMRADGRPDLLPHISGFGMPKCPEHTKKATEQSTGRGPT